MKFARLFTRPLRPGMTLPLLAVVAISATDLVAGRDRFVTPMMVIAPALAAITTTWRRTLVVGLIGLLAQAALAPFDGVLDPEDRRLLQGQVVSYLTVTAFSAYIAWRYEQGRKAYAAVHSVAEAAQHALLRPPGPRVGGVRLAVRYVSASDAAQIGGDLYAVLDTPHGVRALVGDVRGKGLGAVQTASVVLGAFREAAYDEGGLGRVAERVDTSVCRHLDTELTGEFTTALFAQFRGSRHVELLHYGHVAPLRVSADGAVSTLDPPDPWLPLGLGDLTPAGAPKPWTVALGSADVLVLCTDGVIEARSPDTGGFYPLAERAAGIVAGTADDLEPAVDRLYADLVRHAGGALTDDAVLLLLARP